MRIAVIAVTLLHFVWFEGALTHGRLCLNMETSKCGRQVHLWMGKALGEKCWVTFCHIQITLLHLLVWDSRFQWLFQRACAYLVLTLICFVGARCKKLCTLSAPQFWHWWSGGILTKVSTPVVDVNFFVNQGRPFQLFVFQVRWAPEYFSSIQLPSLTFYLIVLEMNRLYSFTSTKYKQTNEISSELIHDNNRRSETISIHSCIRHTCTGP